MRVYIYIYIYISDTNLAVLALDTRSALAPFLILFAALYAGFGVQSPYLPALLDDRGAAGSDRLETRWLVSSPCADAGATASPAASPSAATPKARATVDLGIGFSSLIERPKGALLAQATC